MEFPFSLVSSIGAGVMASENMYSRQLFGFGLGGWLYMLFPKMKCGRQALSLGPRFLPFQNDRRSDVGRAYQYCSGSRSHFLLKPRL